MRDKELSIDNIENVAPLDEMNKLLEGYTEEVHIDEEVIQKIKSKGRGRPKNKTIEAVKEPAIEISELINGGLFILLIDLVLPNILALANNQMTSKKIKAKDLQLTEKQRGDLEPMANIVAKKFLENVDPMYMFFISLIGIYGINFMMLKAGDE